MAKKSKRSWKDLSPKMRALIIVAATVQIGLISVAHADISRRPAEQIRGPKRMWRLISLVNFVGPLTYFAAGRRPAGDVAGR